MDSEETQEADTKAQYIDSIAASFLSDWQDGKSPQIEDYLEGNEGEVRDKLLWQLIRIDIDQRSDAGEKISIEIYINRFPELLEPDETIPIPLLALEHKAQMQADGGLKTAATIDLYKGTKVVKFVTCPHCFSANQAARTDTLEIVCFDCRKTFNPQTATLSESPAEQEDLPTPANLKIGPYEVIQIIGKGAYGAVFKAEDKELNRMVALKVPRAGAFPQQGVRRLFEHRFYRNALWDEAIEARIAGTGSGELIHLRPEIPTVLDSSSSASRYDGQPVRPAAASSQRRPSHRRTDSLSVLRRIASAP
jgi:hypothetical protein